ncbi:hypothetical protein ACFFX0_08770 [Citricoccus parietis]|uniref:Uncharacterized protein n=1 Tax=Citricoccus parietis TaxID=592307 RepID=A0ABV5FX58_9MICC
MEACWSPASSAMPASRAAAEAAPLRTPAAACSSTERRASRMAAAESPSSWATTALSIHMAARTARLAWPARTSSATSADLSGSWPIRWTWARNIRVDANDSAGTGTPAATRASRISRHSSSRSTAGSNRPSSTCRTARATSTSGSTVSTEWADRVRSSSSTPSSTVASNDSGSRSNMVPSSASSRAWWG